MFEQSYRVMGQVCRTHPYIYVLIRCKFYDTSTNCMSAFAVSVAIIAIGIETLLLISLMHLYIYIYIYINVSLGHVPFDVSSRSKISLENAGTKTHIFARMQRRSCQRLRRFFRQQPRMFMDAALHDVRHRMDEKQRRRSIYNIYIYIILYHVRYPIPYSKPSRQPASFISSVVVPMAERPYS